MHPEDAFDMLSKASQDSKRKLRDLAESMVTGVSKDGPKLAPAEEHESGS